MSLARLRQRRWARLRARVDQSAYHPFRSNPLFNSEDGCRLVDLPDHVEVPTRFQHVIIPKLGPTCTEPKRYRNPPACPRWSAMRHCSLALAILGLVLFVGLLLVPLGPERGRPHRTRTVVGLMKLGGRLLFGSQEKIAARSWRTDTSNRFPVDCVF